MEKNKGERFSITKDILYIKKCKIFIEENFDMKPMVKENDSITINDKKRKYYDAFGILKIKPDDNTDCTDVYGLLKVSSLGDGMFELNNKKYKVNKDYDTFESKQSVIYVMPKEELLKKETLKADTLKNYMYLHFELKNALFEDIEEHPKGCRCKECKKVNKQEHVKGCMCEKCKKINKKIDISKNSDKSHK